MSVSNISICFPVFLILCVTVLVQCCSKNTFEGTKLTALQDIALDGEITDFNYFTKAQEEISIPVYQVWGCISPNEGFGNAVAIEIKNQNVPIFYTQAVHNLPFLHSLHVISSGVFEIQSGAFHNLPSLTILKIEDNSIARIPMGLFNNLMIKKLVLSLNLIEYIHAEAFNDMPRLESVKLDFNRLSSWNTDWFWNCPKVQHLSTKFNELTFIPGKAFRNVEHTLQRLYLSDNSISDISARAFAGLRRLTDLSLCGNSNLTNLDELTFLYLEHLKVIDLSDTNITCFSDALLNTLRPDVLLRINNVPLNSTCVTILKEWALDNRNDLTFYENLKEVGKKTTR